MKKTSLLFVIALFVFSAFTTSTTVLPYYSDSSKVVKLNHYDGKDKFNGYSTVEFKSIKEGVLTLNEKAYASDGDFITGIDFKVKKNESATAYDMNYMLGSSLEIISDPKLEISEHVCMEFPDEVKVGDVLKDALMRGVIYSKGSKFGSLELTCANRKVVEKAEIETEIGKYESYCVEFTFISKIGFVKFTNTKRFWYNNELGIIKSDRHSKKGKYSGKSVLAEVK